MKNQKTPRRQAEQLNIVLPLPIIKNQPMTKEAKQVTGSKNRTSLEVRLLGN